MADVRGARAVFDVANERGHNMISYLILGHSKIVSSHLIAF